jgi:hypothetical protein
MREVQGNLFYQEVDIICIATNGSTKKDGRAIMGCGSALDAAMLWPDLPLILGEKLIVMGNHVFILKWDEAKEYNVVSFPTKEKWNEDADLKLVEQSTKELVELVNLYEKHQNKKLTVALSRVACGAGKKTWKEIKPLLEKYLDDRFTIVEFGNVSA